MRNSSAKECIFITEKGETIRKQLEKELVKYTKFQRNNSKSLISNASMSASKTNKDDQIDYHNEGSFQARDNPLPLINTRQGSIINEEDEGYSDQLAMSKYSYEKEGGHRNSELSKVVVYSRKKEYINDKVVYTISDKNEKPPRIDDLLPLKVKVPKIKVSKYFEDKYSDRELRKIGENEFMSSKNMEDDINHFDYNYKQSGSPNQQKITKGNTLTMNASMDGVKSSISEILQERTEMPSINRNNNSVMEVNFLGSSDSVGSLKRYGSTHKLIGLKFQNTINHDKNKRSSIALNSKIAHDYKGGTNLINNSSFSHRDLEDASSTAENRYQKLYQKMNKMQKMRLQMVNQIKEKAQNLRETHEKHFESNVRVFDKKATKDLEGIFRDTKFDERKRERLGKWKSKKYTHKSQL